MTQDATPHPAASKKSRIKVAQLVAEAVNVLCPECGEPQPDPDNESHMWLPQQVEKYAGRRTCVACDAQMLVVTRRTVQF